MSKYIICDTETSGLNTGVAEMYSFGGIIAETNSKGTLDMLSMKMVHRFFNTDKIVPADATAVHGLTNELILKYSHGDYLEDCYHELDDYIYAPDTTLVGYNINFDKTILTNNLIRNGLEPPKWKGTIDVMQVQKPLLVGTGYDRQKGIKLIKAKYLILNRKCNCDDEKIKKVFNVLCEKNNIDCASNMFHSALWDTFITALLFNEVLRYNK